MDVQPHLLNLSAYINQNLEKDLPLASLAKRVGLSPFHFHRKFGAYFGESLHQHIKRLRLERAAYALRHGTTSVRQIARESGYKTVSAFSHAFSGFAGESPTRYRSLAVRGDGATTEQAKIEPTWVGEVEAQPVLFVRAVGAHEDMQAAIKRAVDHVAELAGRPTTSDADGEAEPIDIIAATSDVFRVANGDDFRIDICVDMERVDPERRKLFGTQTLPGGRYARFDLRCLPSEAITAFADAALRGLREPPRLAQYFVRFDGATKDEDGRHQYRFFVPLSG